MQGMGQGGEYEPGSAYDVLVMLAIGFVMVLMWLFAG